MKHLCGTLPDRPVTRFSDAVAANYGSAKALPAPGTGRVLAVPSPRRIQFAPACLGYSGAEIIDAAHGNVITASAIGIWREARRRQGLIENIDEGTRTEYMIDGLIHRGWDHYKEGEDTDPVEAGRGAAPAGDDLASELDAYDHRGTTITHYRIFELDALSDATDRGLGVSGAFGLKEPFFNLKPNEVATAAHMGGEQNGHAVRIVRVWKMPGGRYRALGQNHWPDPWGGAHDPEGQYWPWCFLIDEDALVGAWDLYALEVAH